jgi:DNA-binding FrmR family transcriptional regulator
VSHRTDSNSEESREIAKRLARISGHAESLKRLWDEGRDCEDILTQISAVRAALDRAGKAILEHHIGHCVVEAIEQGRADDAIAELKKALHRL